MAENLSSARSRRLLATLTSTLVTAGACYVATAAPASAADPVRTQGPTQIYLEVPASTGPTSQSVTEVIPVSAFSLATTAGASLPKGDVTQHVASPATAQASATLPFDTASVDFLEDAVTGRLLSSVDVLFYRSTQKTAFLTYGLRGIRITSYQLSDSAGQATVQIAFTFGGIQVVLGPGATKGASPAPVTYDLSPSKVS